MAEIGPRQHMGMEPSDPNNPTNKPGYDLLPDGALCRSCACFEGFAGSTGFKKIDEMLTMIVTCGSPSEKVETQVILASENAHDGIVYRGNCFNDEGYTLHGVFWTNKNAPPFELIKAALGKT